MAHYCPGPRHSSTAGTALPGAEGTPQLSVPAQLGTAQGGRAFLCPGSTGLARESSLSPHRAGSAQHPAHGWAPANRELLPGEPQPTGIGAQSLKAERGLGACSKQSQRGEHTAGTKLLSPRSLQLHQLFLPACLPHCTPRAEQGSRCRGTAAPSVLTQIQQSQPLQEG